MDVLDSLIVNVFLSMRLDGLVKTLDSDDLKILKGNFTDKCEDLNIKRCLSLWIF